MIALALYATPAGAAPIVDMTQDWSYLGTNQSVSGTTSTQNGHAGQWISGCTSDQWRSTSTLLGQTKVVSPMTDESMGVYGPPSDYYDNHLTYTGREYRDFTLSTWLLIDAPLSGMDSIGVVFRWTDPSNYYFAFVSSSGDIPRWGTGDPSGGVNQQQEGVYLVRVTNNVATLLTFVNGPDLSRGNWTPFQVQMVGNSISVAMDMNNDNDVIDVGDKLINNYVDNAPIVTNGRLGLWAFDTGYMSAPCGFDNFMVTIDDADGDLDGVPDARDNCVTIANPTQTDANGNHIGDVCDGMDADGDGTFTPADCNDGDPSVRPGATETCDNVDSDCDTDLVDGFTDFDKDKTPDCIDPDDDGDGVADGADCKPFDAGVYPGALETCDSVDSDCNGDFVDGFLDTDKDKTPDCVDADDDADGSNDATDCAPLDKTRYPNAPEVCDDIDSDCDGDKVDTFADTDTDKAPDCTDLDDDGDGVVDTSDCKALDKTVYPGAPETCDAVDQDCDGNVVENFPNFDGDALPDCSDTDDDNDGVSPGDTAPDCNDNDKTIYPGAVESNCDTIDSDCDGDISDGIAADYDKDSQPDCTDPDDDNDGSADASDCNDFDATIRPNATETCDAIDSDCDGDLVDTFADTDTDKQPDCTDADDDGDGSLDTADCAATDKTRYPGATEACDKIDSNCDNSLIDGFTNTDNDTEPDCVDLDDDGDAFNDASDCDPLTKTTYPGATETCDFVDSDCDKSLVDSFTDTDKDTVPDCVDPDDDDDAEGDSTDCAPTDPAVNHGAAELCNGVDDDCSGTKDDPYATDAKTWYHDVDQDGFGVASDQQPGCTAPAGYVATSGDCNDFDKFVKPGVYETCDGRDEDCDGFADDEDPDDIPVDAYDWFMDNDSDTYGDLVNSVLACQQPPGTTDLSAALDCDDTNPDVSPSGIEICANVTDDDCDGTIDNTTTTFQWWKDADDDGFGDASTSPVDDCGPPSADYVDNGTDCDDDDDAVNPAVDEEPGNGKDDDCDPETTDDLPVDTGDTGDTSDTSDTADTDTDTDDTSDTAATDADGDGVPAGEDCDDADGSVHPGAEELVDDVDQDCDGAADPAVAVTLKGCGCSATSGSRAAGAPGLAIALLGLLFHRRRR